MEALESVKLLECDGKEFNEKVFDELEEKLKEGEKMGLGVF